MSIDSLRSILAALACLSAISCASAPRAVPPSQAAAVSVSQKPTPRVWTPMERKTVEMSFISLAGCWQDQPRAVAADITDLMLAVRFAICPLARAVIPLVALIDTITPMTTTSSPLLGTWAN